MVCSPAVAQQSADRSVPPSEWNAPRVLDLVGRAREARSSTAVDSTFQSYRADARGYVYFFIDRPDADDRTLVKADQIALEVYWKAPNLTRQRIVGLRDRKVLPTSIRYHLDHLTVVQDDFGDWIRMGDGDEVERVLHPIGPESEVLYDFLLADSLTIRYGGADDLVRVYEVRVRPRTPDLPGYIGSVFIDRDNAAIVRMNFTFTPASYVDPYLDYIRVSLDNSLWDGRFWLPYRQEVELRREMPALDFLAGSIIRGRFEIGGYDFNVPTEQSFFGQRVTSVGEAQRASFPFERGLFDDLDERGLAPTPSLDDIRAKARQIVADRLLSGLAPLRLSLRSVSDAARYNRAEGVFLGGGATLRTAEDGHVRLGAGYSFGRNRASFHTDVVAEGSPLSVDLSLYWDALRDRGPRPGTSTALNSVAAATGRADYLDPWFARGMRVGIRPGRTGASPELRLTWEEHRSAEDVVDRGFRPVAPVREGVLGSVGVYVPGRLAGAEAWIEGTAARFRTERFVETEAGAVWRVDRSEDRRPSFEIEVRAGSLAGDPPSHLEYYLGGPGTVPGHAFRGLHGNAYGLARATLTVPAWSPWAGLRVLGAAGAVHDPGSAEAARPDDLGATDRTRAASVGAGLSLFWDVLRLDLHRGLGTGGEWAWVFSVTPRFTSWL